MKNFLLRNKWRIMWIIFAVALVVTCQIKSYYALIVALIGIYSIVASSLDILFGYTGQISLGHAGLFAIGAYSTALLTMRLNIPTLLSLILGTIITTIIGILIAIPASKLIKHFLSLLMIAFGQVVYLIINSWIDFTGGSLGIMYIPSLNLFGLHIDSNFKNAIVIWVILALLLFIKNRIVHSRVGKIFISIRENPVAAKGLGINVRKYKVMAFAISAFMTGIAGGLYAFLRGFISPETFNGTQSTLFMTMLLFGGITSLGGSVIGASVLLLIKELLQSFSNWQGLIYALFMLVVLFFFPNGVIGLFKDIRRKLLEKTKNNVEAENVKG